MGNNVAAVEAFNAANDALAHLPKKHESKHSQQYSKQPEHLPMEPVPYFVNVYRDDKYEKTQRFEIFKFEVPDTLDVNDTTIHGRDLLKEKFPEFMAARGKAKALLGKYDDAIDDFIKSSEMDPSNAQTYFE